MLCYKGAYKTKTLCSLFKECQSGELGQPKMNGTKMKLVKDSFKT